MEILQQLQNFIPRYVLGCLPALAITGNCPYDSFVLKLFWLVRCLGSPFVPLFYFLNVDNEPLALSTFWLSVDYFESGTEFRPVGHHFMKIDFDRLEKNMADVLKECTSRPSVLDMASSFVSLAYILVGISMGIIGTITPCSVQEWSFISFSLSWTSIAIIWRIFRKRSVVIDPKNRLDEFFKKELGERLKKYKEKKSDISRLDVDRLSLEEMVKEIKKEREYLDKSKNLLEEGGNELNVNLELLEGKLEKLENRLLKGKKIPLKKPGDDDDDDDDDDDEGLSRIKTLMTFVFSAIFPWLTNWRKINVFITAAFSALFPWMTLFITYYTLPVGFRCRSGYFTILCLIWTVNSVVAYTFHLKGEKDTYGNRAIDVLFCVSGVIVAGLLIFLVLLDHMELWWVTMFGSFCSMDNDCAAKLS